MSSFRWRVRILIIEFITIISIFSGIVVAIITIYDQLIVERKRRKLIEELTKVIKGGRFYLKWKANVEILNFEGDAHYKHSVTYVNMENHVVYNTWHHIWGSSSTSRENLKLKAYNKKGALKTNILTETPSYRRLSVTFRDEGIALEEPYKYYWEHEYPKQYGKLIDGEWYEFSLDSPIADLEIVIKLPKNAIMTSDPICYTFQNGQKTPIQELKTRFKKGHPFIKFKTEKISAYQVFRIEFSAKPTPS